MFRRTPRALEDLSHVAARLLLVQLLALRHEREQLATADPESRRIFRILNFTKFFKKNIEAPEFNHL